MINKKKNLEIKKSLNHVNQGSKTKNNSIPGGIKEKISFSNMQFSVIRATNYSYVWKKEIS